MAKARARPKNDSAVTDGSDQNRSVAKLSTSGHGAEDPVSEESRAIIKKISVRRRKAIEVLANR